MSNQKEENKKAVQQPVQQPVQLVNSSVFEFTYENKNIVYCNHNGVIIPTFISKL